MKYLLLLLFVVIYANDSLAEVSDTRFQWQASEDQSLYAPFGKAFPTDDFNTSSGKKNISQLVNNEIFLIAVRDPDCPVSRKYATKLIKLNQDGLKIIYLLVGELASNKIVDRDHKRHGIDGLYILDKDRKLSNWLGVETSAEVYLFDKTKSLKYRGAIDDQHGIGFKKDHPKQTFLRDALQALNQNEQVKLVATSAPGCIIRQVNKKTVRNEITWHDEIYPLIQQKCLTCHRPGQAGPFTLESYTDVYKRKEMIRFVLENKIMPPWSVSNDTSRFENQDKYLADNDRQKIIEWIDAGAPQGQENNTSAKTVWTNGWKYGQPDVILTSPELLSIPAEGDIEYKYVTIPTNFGSDRWVHTIEAATDTPENTHHIILFAIPPESNAEKFIPGITTPTTTNQRTYGIMALKGLFSGYIPGFPGIKYKEDSAKLLPRGWRIVLQVHHESNGRAAVDRPRVGLQFLNRPPKNAITTLAASTVDINIPPGASNHLETAEYKFKKHGEIHGLYPHMHLRGSAFKYELILPNGHKETLLDVPSYDPNWQQYYQFREPVMISKGSKLVAYGWYDNSKRNLNNPDPNVEVKFGLKTRDEMLIGYFDWAESKAR